MTRRSEEGTAGGITPAQVTSAHARAADLSARIADLADSIADSEDMVASTLEESARLRPHAADRLLSGARHARDFAEREREQALDLRRPPSDDQPPPDGSDRGAPAAPPPDTRRDET